MNVQPLTPELAEQTWFWLEPWANQLADRFPDDWPVEELKGQIKDQVVVPWIIWDSESNECFGLGLTEIRETWSGKSSLKVFATGKEHEKWVGLITVLEDYARKNGCSKVEIFGRVGWKRSLPDYRQEKFALLTKELTDAAT